MSLSITGSVKFLLSSLDTFGVRDSLGDSGGLGSTRTALAPTELDTSAVKAIPMLTKNFLGFISIPYFTSSLCRRGQRLQPQADRSFRGRTKKTVGHPKNLRSTNDLRRN